MKLKAEGMKQKPGGDGHPDRKIIRIRKRYCVVNIRAEIVIKNISKNLRPHKGNFLKVIKMLRIKLKEHTNTTILKQTTLPWRTQYRNGKQTYHKHTYTQTLTFIYIDI